jgi:tartrate-resistant acid phosphatase type 5
MRTSIVTALLLLGGCATVPATETAPQPIAPYTLLLFGDHGYDLDYLDPEERNPPLTLEKAIAKQRVDWLDDKRPPDEFSPSPLVRLPDTGGYVDASGLEPVTKAMLNHCRTVQCDAAVMLGDNIYPDGPTGGADGVPDAKRFDEILLQPFKDFISLGPDFRIYATLGNHDWRTSREAALSEVRYMEQTRPFYMDGIIYRVKPRDDVEIFVLDTEVLLAGETVYDAELADDGSELPGRIVEEPEPWTRPQTERERNMVAWLEQSLRNSTARWKIVMGHHPLWSSAGSKFEQARVLRRLILPTLCKYSDMYLAGHEHTLELHTDSCAKAVPGSQFPALPHMVSGAAAKQRPVNSRFMAHQARNNTELATDYSKGLIWGYMHLSLDADQATVNVFTTPNDGSGANILETTRVYKRRTGSLSR